MHRTKEGKWEGWWPEGLEGRRPGGREMRVLIPLEEHTGRCCHRIYPGYIPWELSVSNMAFCPGVSLPVSTVHLSFSSTSLPPFLSPRPLGHLGDMPAIPCRRGLLLWVLLVSFSVSLNNYNFPSRQLLLLAILF